MTSTCPPGPQGFTLPAPTNWSRLGSSLLPAHRKELLQVYGQHLKIIFHSPRPKTPLAHHQAPESAPWPTNLLSRLAQTPRTQCTVGDASWPEARTSLPHGHHCTHRASNWLVSGTVLPCADAKRAPPPGVPSPSARAPVHPRGKARTRRGSEPSQVPPDQSAYPCCQTKGDV